jgi:hypothetical protein
MSPESGGLGLAGWEDHELLSTAWENVGLGADEGLPDEVRFVANVTRLIRVRLAEVITGETVPAVFFLLPEGPADVPLKPEPLFHNGLVPFGGAFWFVSPVVTNAHRFALDNWDDAQAFDLAEQELSIGRAVAVLFDPRPATPQLYLYPQGLGERDRAMRLRLDASDVSLADVLDVVDRVHENFLITPGAQDSVGTVWRNRAQFRPVPKAEAVIQMYLRIGLQSAFPSCVVRREQHGVAGRLDLEVAEPVPGRVAALEPKAVLELKVLRSVGSTGLPVSEMQTKEWVKDGIKQVAAYQKERKAREAALCCFDCRREYTGDACFAHVKTLARTNKVVVRVWHLFNSAKAFQSTSVPG